MQTRYQKNLSNLRKHMDALQFQAYCWHHEINDFDDVNFWALHQDAALLVHYIDEENYDAYTKIGRLLYNDLEILRLKFANNNDIVINTIESLNKIIPLHSLGHQS